MSPARPPIPGAWEASRIVAEIAPGPEVSGIASGKIATWLRSSARSGVSTCAAFRSALFSKTIS